MKRNYGFEASIGVLGFLTSGLWSLWALIRSLEKITMWWDLTLTYSLIWLFLSITGIYLCTGYFELVKKERSRNGSYQNKGAE